MAALVAVMIMVSVGTFDWRSLSPGTLTRVPGSETAVMVVTVAVVVATRNLALGVLAGTLLAMVFFARRVAQLAEVSSVLDPEGGMRVYAVTGELFCVSTNELVRAFDYTDPTPDVTIDLTDAHIWNTSAVAALETVKAKFAERGVTVERVGLNQPSSEPHDRTRGRFATSS
jgi:SulP family sulfate permease